MLDLDEKGFRIFPIRLAELLSNKEAYTYLILLFKSDFKTGESIVLLETMSELVGYNSDTISDYLHKAENIGYVEIKRKWIVNEHGKPKTKNNYKIPIPKKDFIIVNKSFLEWHIEGVSLKEETDIKGFILLVKCICLNNCNMTFYSLNQMAKHMKLSYATIQKYMKKCNDFCLILPFKGGYRIMIDSFDLGNTGYFPKGTPILYKDIYNTIASFCYTKGIECPPYKQELISQIAMRYTMTRRELQEMKDIEDIQHFSVEYQLEQRLPNIKEPINSLNYFVKVLTNKDYNIPEQRQVKDFFM